MRTAAAILLILTALASAGTAHADQPTVRSQPLETVTANGTFDVKMTPEGATDAPVGNFLLIKTFHGDLEANSTGRMLAIGTAIPDSAGYVAMERVTGTLAGKTGSFALQHSGTMDRGRPALSVTVVPDSGTEGLTGITGSLDIQIRDGKHFYVFQYTLPR